ncbi:MAG: phosphoglycerate kinase [Patescibacteria group bacterium]
MLNLSKLSSNIDLKGKRVLVRVDLDVPQMADSNDLRLQSMVPTVDYLLKNGASEVILVGHRGRPEGTEDKSLTLKGFTPVLSEIIGEEVVFEADGKIILKENLRFDPGEEANDADFAKRLASMADIYVNEAFAVSHRQHASIVGVPKLLPGFLGLHFEKELENLNRVLENPKRPVVTLISGVKEDKVDMLPGLKIFSDKVLVGGRLPEYIDPDYGKGNGHPELLKDPKVTVGRLIQDREDITIHTAEIFEEEIKTAGTVILAGVMGKYEEEGHRQGTQKVFTAIANSNAFKVAGGGDTETALQMFNLKDKFDWISVGGGAMLEFLINKTLPGIEVLKR